MSQYHILLPILAMVALTMTVWLRMYFDRIGEMRARRISAQEISTARQVSQRLERLNAADNFRNLFEVPVLFYALCITAFAAGAASVLLVTLAWAYVALRCAHSFIHCTYNNVNHRFAVYTISSLIVFASWLMLGSTVATRL